MSQNKENSWNVVYPERVFSFSNKTVGVFINKETMNQIEAKSWVDEGETYIVYSTYDMPTIRVSKDSYTLHKRPYPRASEKTYKMENEEVAGYEKLQEVLHRAYDQAANGKGKERHSSNNTIPFHEQRMQTISDLIKSPKGMEYQVVKKITEGLEMKETERTTKELLGAINYIAGIIIFLEKQDNQ